MRLYRKKRQARRLRTGQAKRPAKDDRPLGSAAWKCHTLPESRTLYIAF
jgi:hypothetical protein